MVVRRSQSLQRFRQQDRPIARWTAISYTIHFDTSMKDVIGMVADRTYKFNSSCDAMTLPMGESLNLGGHMFFGWSLGEGESVTIFAAGSAIREEICNALLATQRSKISSGCSKVNCRTYKSFSLWITSNRNSLNIWITTTTAESSQS